MTGAYRGVPRRRAEPPRPAVTVAPPSQAVDEVDPVARLAARRAAVDLTDVPDPWAPSPDVADKRRAYLAAQRDAAEPEPDLTNPAAAVDRLTARREVQ